MMRFWERIFDVFSKRTDPAVHQPALPATFRRRLILFCNEVFSNERVSWGGTGDYRSQLWAQVHRFLQYRLGELRLTRESSDPTGGTIWYLLTEADDAIFLDFVEYIFRVDAFFHVALPDQQVIDEVNDLFRIDNLPYHLTNFVREEVSEDWDQIPRRGGITIKTLAYPRIVLRASELEHQEVIAPTLRFLEHHALRNANLEFLEALEAFRKNDFGNSLTHCGSAFESALKVICDEHRWPYNQTDTAAVLVRTVVERASLDSYFEPLLMIVATLRNRLSKAHGAGARERVVPRHLARYAINATGSAILLLVETAGLNP